MNLTNLLILQLIAHLCADFNFQPANWAEDKIEKGLKSKKFQLHLVIVFIFSWFLSLQWNFIFASLAITIAHLLIDEIKKTLVNNKRIKNSTFYIDQVLHLISIEVIVFLFIRYFSITPSFIITVNTKFLLILTAYLFCTKPANILIKEILKSYNIKIFQNENDNIPNVGKLIGNVERILALTLILNNEYQVVGFIIAAKSILRFKEIETPKTEYVLVGTLLSFGIAILVGVSLRMIK
jgi:hypothetical protein